MKFCSDCGSKLEKRIPEGDNLERDCCTKCDLIHYSNPKVIVGTVPIKDNKVLLCKRAIQPRYGLWTLPAGFLENGETIEEGAFRETKEETGIIVQREEILGQLKPVTTLNSGFTILPFVCMLNEIKNLIPNSEVDEFLEIPLMPFLQTLADDSDPEHNSIQEMYTFTFEKHLIWGASARMLKQIVTKLRTNG